MAKWCATDWQIQCLDSRPRWYQMELSYAFCAISNDNAVLLNTPSANESNPILAIDWSWIFILMVQLITAAVRSLDLIPKRYVMAHSKITPLTQVNECAGLAKFKTMSTLHGNGSAVLSSVDFTAVQTQNCTAKTLTSSNRDVPP